MMSNAGKYDELLHNGKNMILYLQLRLLIKEGYKIMKLKNFFDWFVNVGRSCGNVCGYA